MKVYELGSECQLISENCDLALILSGWLLMLPIKSLNICISHTN